MINTVYKCSKLSKDMMLTQMHCNCVGLHTVPMMAKKLGEGIWEPLFNMKEF